MVDKKYHPDAMTLEMMLREGMTPELEAGVRHFLLECTGSYNVASRRYSIWGLLSKHIDTPLTESFRRLDLANVFDGQFSKWLQNKRMADMSIFFNALSHSNEFNPELKANIESLIEISYFTLAKRPSKKIAVPGEKGSPQFNHRKKVDHRHYPYCELCWRLSQAAERNINNPEESFATQRFCSEHNPSIPTSKYRNDHRFRSRFNEGLKKIKSVKHKAPLDDSTIRKLAYDYAHSRKPSLHDEILKLYNEGLKNSEIAKNLNITRQAVSKSLNAIRPI